jgi:hypothetical protein
LRSKLHLSSGSGAFYNGVPESELRPKGKLIKKI